MYESIAINADSNSHDNEDEERKNCMSKDFLIT
jgi:hypothetical protein